MMRNILRFIYVIMAPIVALAIGYSASACIFPMIHHEDPLRNKIDSIARNFHASNQYKRERQPLTLFNGYFFIASKTITKGETISADSLEREFYELQLAPGRGLKLSKQTVVQSVAAKDIARDQLITAADLVPNVSVQNSSTNLDQTVKTASDDKRMPAIWHITAALMVAAGLCVYCYGAISLIVLAFRKSLGWGLSFVLIPFAPVVFKLQNWQMSRRFFHFTLIGCVLMSFAAMMILADIRRPLSL